MATPKQTAAQLKRLFSYMPGIFAGKKNFSALMGAIAQSDADLTNLFIDVRQQLFIDTASGQYLDMLGSNVGVTRPPLIGMVDQDFRSFIKLETYYPKQIRQLLFRLMELFYGTDTIKASAISATPGPYAVFDGADLQVNIDGIGDFDIVFSVSDFNTPSSVSSTELAADINSKISSALFASVYTNATDKLDFLQLFTNTYGPVGSITITGGSANRFLKFPSTFNLGADISSQYRLVKQSTTMLLYWAGGDNPEFSLLNVGDSVILTGTPFSTGNRGSFPILAVRDSGVSALILPTTSAILQSPNVVRYTMVSTTNISPGQSVTIAGFSLADNNGTFVVQSVATNAHIDVVSTRTTHTDDETHAGTVDLLPGASHIEFSNENGTTTGTFGVTTTDDVLFFRPTKMRLESAARQATIWEVTPNSITVTLPATPIVIRRGLAGSAHLQGTTAAIVQASPNSITLASDDFFPLTNGRFWLQSADGYLDTSVAYTYTTLDPSTKTLSGLSQPIAAIGTQLKLGVAPLASSSGTQTITVTTIAPHGMNTGEIVNFADFIGFAGITDVQLNGNWTVNTIIDQVTFTVNVGGSASSTATNSPELNKGHITTTHGSKVEITNIQQGTGYVGSYIYDPLHAPYTISGVQAKTQQSLLVGAFAGSIQLDDSSVFTSDSGEVVISYGRADEEGPIRYIAVPSTGSIFLDPAYRFKKSHPSGVAINLLSSRAGTQVTPNGSDFPVYVVDTVGPRNTLEVLIQDAAAAGVFINFVVVLPHNVYNAFGLYS